MNYLKANLMLLILFYSDQLFLFICVFIFIQLKGNQQGSLCRSLVLKLCLAYFGYQFEAFVCVGICHSCHIYAKDGKGKNFDRINDRSLI